MKYFTYKRSLELSTTPWEIELYICRIMKFDNEQTHMSVFWFYIIPNKEVCNENQIYLDIVAPPGVVPCLGAFVGGCDSALDRPD